MWRDLLQKDEAIVSPWLEGRSLRTFTRRFTIEGALPPEPGWHRFEIAGRKARWSAGAEPDESALSDRVRGYLIGDRLVPDDVAVRPELGELARGFQRVHLIEPGLDRFARVCVARFYEAGPLIFAGLEFPLGPEDDVARALLDGKRTLDDVPGVAPALDAAFRVEIWRREQAERRRREAELERQRLAEEAAREERRRRVAEQLGDAVLRRELAAYDFEAAARAALALGGAEFVDHQRAYQRGEMLVRFRIDGQHFACTCDATTLRIIDSGICLVDHHTDERGDDRFTLESLPAVIRQAEREGSLVVFRHF
ncbi:MAG TPA: hypothetical protein VM686_17285 [Polyangiaceae bacterium]|nr:hypothetical protein [Polyangiaceae bacterium]